MNTKIVAAVLAGSLSLTNAYTRQNSEISNGWATVSVNVDGVDQNLYIASGNS
jgi:hypothetical protein